MFSPLLENELLKLNRRRRPQLVFTLLMLFLVVASWAQKRQMDNARSESGQADWRPVVEQRIVDTERRAERRRVFVGFSRFLRFEAARLRYHLEQGMDPDAMSGPGFARGLPLLASTLLFPLLVTILATDIVSSETTAGTIKMLLTRPISRQRILAAKFIAVALYTTLLIAIAALFSWLISGCFFGWSGWQAPVLSGFRFRNASVDLSAVRQLPLWLDTLATYGLAWASALSVGVIAVTASVLFRATAAAMGTLMAMLVAGLLVGQVASDWQPMSWFFATNLGLPQLRTGMPPPVEGMTLLQATLVLGCWCAAALTISFWVFVRRDVVSSSG